MPPGPTTSGVVASVAGIPASVVPPSFGRYDEPMTVDDEQAQRSALAARHTHRWLMVTEMETRGVQAPAVRKCCSDNAWRAALPPAWRPRACRGDEGNR